MANIVDRRKNDLIFGFSGFHFLYHWKYNTIINSKLIGIIRYSIGTQYPNRTLSNVEKRTKERPFSISGKKYGCDIDKLYRKELSKQNDLI